MKRKYDFFYNELFFVLLKLKEHEIRVNGVYYSPLVYKDIGAEMNLTRQTVSKYIQKLADANYINILQKGKIQITEEGNKAIQTLK